MQYCERTHQSSLHTTSTDASLFAEPFNLLSNAAFIIAAALVWYRFKLRAAPTRSVTGDSAPSSDQTHLSSIYILLMVMVGLGSASYHALPNQLNLAADLVPILLLSGFLCYGALRRWLDLSTRVAGMLAILMILFTVSLFPFRDLWNGSFPYLPLLIALLLIAGVLKKQIVKGGFNSVKKSNLWLQCALGSAALLALALLARTIDITICSSVPTGTHFIWHVLAAACSYRLASGVLSRH